MSTRPSWPLALVKRLPTEFDSKDIALVNMLDRVSTGLAAESYVLSISLRSRELPKVE
jgi:hypothetical protein